MENIINNEEIKNENGLNNITIGEYYKLIKDFLLNKIQINNKGKIIFTTKQYIENPVIKEDVKILLTQWASYFLYGEEHFLYQNLLSFFIPLLNKEPEDEMFFNDSIEDKILIRYNILNIYKKYYFNLKVFNGKSLNKIMLNLFELLEKCDNEYFLNNIYKNLPNLLIIRNEKSELIAIPFTIEIYTKFINFTKERLIYKKNPEIYLNNLIDLWRQLDKIKKNDQEKGIINEDINKEIEEDKKNIELIIENIDRNIIVDNKVKLLKKFLDNKDDIIKKMKQEIIGQDNIIDEIFPSIGKIIMRLNEKPSSFLFLGESGVGKTKLGKVIAETLGSEVCIINLGNYHSEHNMASIVGAPHGYAGFGQETLIEKYINGLKANHKEDSVIPVIIFDEIEKADESIQNIWLELLDLGTITLMNGKILDLKGSIIILTSNLGIQKGPKIGFGINNETKEQKQRIKENEILNSVNKFLKKEIINRIEKILIFNSLGDEDIKKIKVKIKKDILEKQVNSNEVLQKFLRYQKKDKEELIKYLLQKTKNINLKQYNNNDETINIRKFEKELENIFYNLIIDFLNEKK